MFWVADSQGLQIFDVSNLSTSPVLVGTIAIAGGGGTAEGLAVQGRYAYVVNYGSNTLQVFSLGGTYTQSLQAGSTETTSLQVDNNANVSGNTNIQGGLSVGGNTELDNNLGVAGQVMLQDSNNSAYALQVATNTGNGILNVDTANSRVGIGSLAAPTGLSATLATGGSLPASTTYYFELTAVDGSGGQSATSAEAAGSAATSSTCTTSGSCEYTLSWTGSPGAVSYDIYYGTSSGAEADMINTGSSATSYTFSSASGTAATPPTLSNAYADRLSATQNIFQSTTNSTNYFQIQNASGIPLLTADTTNMQIIIGNTTNGVAISAANGITLYGTAQHNKSIILTPEYAGAVLDSGGAANDVGTMSSGFDSAKRESYYLWTTSQTTNQQYDIVVQIPLPSGFSTWASTTPISIDVKTSDTTNGTVTADLIDTNGTTDWTNCSLTPSSSGTWTTMTGCSVSGANNSANGIMTLTLILQSPPSGATQVGNITLNYKSAY